MKDNDQIILEQAYTNKIQKVIKEQLDDNQYEAEVEVDIYVEGKKKEQPVLEDYKLKARVKYTMDLDIRKYGIKDISVYNVKVEPFEVDWQWEEEFNQGEKPEPLKISIEEGLQVDTGLPAETITLPFYPITLELYLDSNYKPILEKSSLLFNQRN